MRVHDVMTPDPAFCTPDCTAQEVALLMKGHDCGSIPIVNDRQSRRLVGTVTDRDLAVRGIAAGKGPDTPVRELMTERPVTCGPEDEVEIVREVMVAQQVRRVPVVGENGLLVGKIGRAHV